MKLKTIKKISENNLLLILISIHIIALVAAVPSHSSASGIMISAIYFFLTYAVRQARQILAKCTIYLYSLFVLIFLMLQAPLTVEALLSLNYNLVVNRPENIVYAFKQLSLFGYDSNYIGLILIILAVTRNSITIGIMALFTGARAVIFSGIIFLVANKFMNLNRLIVWVGLLIVSTVMYTTVDFSEDSRSLYLKQLTILSFTENLISGNIGNLLFGDGIESAEDQSFVTGHTLLGTVNKNGVLYVLLSLINLRVILKYGNDKISGPVFIVYLSALLSMTAIYFVLPLIYALGYLKDE